MKINITGVFEELEFSNDSLHEDLHDAIYGYFQNVGNAISYIVSNSLTEDFFDFAESEFPHIDAVEYVYWDYTPVDVLKDQYSSQYEAWFERTKDFDLVNFINELELTGLMHRNVFIDYEYDSIQLDDSVLHKGRSPYSEFAATYVSDMDDMEFYAVDGWEYDPRGVIIEIYNTKVMVM